MAVIITCLAIALVAAGVGLTAQHQKLTKLERAVKDSSVDQTLPAVISHELRTPLTLVRGAAELLAEESPGPLNAQQRTFVNTILTHTQLSIDIAENFVSNMRIDAAGISPALVDVRQVIARALKDMRTFTDADITVNAPGGLLPIYADPQLIHQLVWNLVNNAVRHAGEGAHVRVHVANGEEGGLHLRVEDDGRGMSTQELSEVFTPFVSGNTRRPGSGIGMMISKKIVDAHGSQILIDSKPGHGTVSHVILPSQPPASSDVKPRTRRRSAQQPRGSAQQPRRPSRHPRHPLRHPRRTDWGQV